MNLDKMTMKELQTLCKNNKKMYVGYSLCKNKQKLIDFIKSKEGIKLTGDGLLELIRKEKSVYDILEKFDTYSEKGNVYEKLWDIIIKFGCFDKFNNYSVDHYYGNINTCNLMESKDLELYLKNLKVLSKNNGGSSDITMKYKSNDTWIFLSSKYYSDDNNKSIKDYDIQDIMAVMKAKSYYYKDYQICLLVNDKSKVEKIIKSSYSTNNYLASNVSQIFDLVDLENCFQKCKKELDNVDNDKINAKFCNEKLPLEMRFHQKLVIHKTMKLIDAGSKDFLWGWKCRAGKTYGIGGLLVEYFKIYGGCNALIITPAPTETLPQFTNDLFYKFRDFNDFNIIDIKNGSALLNINMKENNIIIVSKQLLDDYINDKKIEKITGLDLIVFDENHYGGTTLRSNDILKTYADKKTVKLYLTATYQKTLKEWNIPLECQFFWDIEDEQLCKKRDINNLITKHGIDVMEFINDNNKEAELSIYDKMPNMHIITTMMDNKKYEIIKDKIMNTKYGFSIEVLFSLNKTGKEFNYPQEVIKVLGYISGSNKEVDYPYGDKSIFNRIKNISLQDGSRTTLDNENFTSQLWFLPYGVGMNIDKVSKCLMKKMLNDKVLKNYEIMIINSKKDYKLKNLKLEINQREIKAKEEGKTGLILLAGNQCSLGITLPLVDIVMLLNNTLSSDRILQMMYRCMSESEDGSKKNGYVVDLNISRVLNTTLEYKVLEKDLTVEDKIKYLIENNLINIDNDLFQSKDNKTKLVEKLMDIWKSDPINNLKRLLRKIEDNIIELENADQKLLNYYFTSIGKDKINIHIKFDEEIDQELPKGQIIEKENNSQSGEDDTEASETSEECVEDEKEFKISLTKDILPFVIPLSCVLTMNDDKTDFIKMLEIIKYNEDLLSIFNEQSFIWWNKDGIIDLIANIIQKYVKKNSEIYNIAIQFKMSLQSLIDRPKELLELIDSCLKPKDVEKKKFGEVFTPMSLINEMLDKLDHYYRGENNGQSIFSREDYKWFDPANGMGNFPVAIYQRLINNLKGVIKDEKERKKHILENMLYMSELNKKNVFVCKQIFDINNEYKLNLYCGDSLTLDTKKEWSVDKFDVIISNPPYNQELTNTGAKPLYNKFIEKYIDHCRYLSFIVPSRWFSGGKGLDKFRKMMLNRKDLAYIQHFDNASKIFGSNVDIKGGVNYFLRSYDYNGDCKFNNSMLVLNKYDVFIDSKYYEIIDKILEYESINKIYIGRYFGIESNDKRLCNDNKLIKCYVSQQKGFEKYIDEKHINKEYKFWKLITARAAHKANSGFGNTFLGNINEIHTGSYISFRLNTENEANSLLSYMKCKLPNFMLSLRKNSQDISEKTCKWIPLPPLDREWKDNEVYKYFKLSKDHIKLIKETKIIGYKDIPDTKKIKIKKV